MLGYLVIGKVDFKCIFLVFILYFDIDVEVWWFKVKILVYFLYGEFWISKYNFLKCIKWIKDDFYLGFVIF